MRVYQLIWALLKHALHGRFRDEVFVSVHWDLPDRDGAVAGEVTGFTWESNNDAFCMIDAVSTDGPWADSTQEPDIAELIEASSLGTPEAKALRDSVRDEVAERIVARSREIAAEEAGALVKVTVNLTERAHGELESTSCAEALSRTDVINRAILVYSALASAGAGRRVTISDHNGKPWRVVAIVGDAS